ncbi:MAG: zinc ribbon domain-containing protein, partial [Candidatus Eisenbacteria bacterium]|nr:zinc ribbon domain-containing protein [Candidatus Eisenbacteria bacterium]
ETELPGDALYCPHCGRAIDNRESIYCWRCGTLLPADARYCTLCGSEVCSDHGATQKDSRARRRQVPRSTAPAAPAQQAEAPAPQAEAPALPAEAPTLPPESPAPPGTPPAAEAAGPGAEASGEGLGPAADRAPVAPAARPAVPLRPRRERMLVQSPRVITSPTGAILPSLALHLSTGWSFGFSDRKHSGGWLFSFGLGGVGEAMITSSRILHILEAQSNALAGFRVHMPVGLLDRRLAERLAVALNVAATASNNYDLRSAFTAEDGATVQWLDYDHRETTLGLAATWTHARLRLHAAAHGTDLRTENITYAIGTTGQSAPGRQRDTYATIGIGLDYALDERTRVIGELRTVPRISFRAAEEDLRVGTLTEYAAGLRFYPVPLLGLDATLSVDEEALGLADMEIGFGVHLTLGPRQAVLAPANEEAR